MSVLSVTSAVTEVPGVNNAVEHLQELGDASVTFTTIWSPCEEIYKKSATDLDQHIKFYFNASGVILVTSKL